MRRCRTDKIGLQIHRLELGGDFQDATHIGDHAQRRRALGDQIRRLSLRLQLLYHLFLHPILIHPIRHQAHIGAQDIVEQLIALHTHLTALVEPVHQHALHAQLGGGGGGLPCVVRLGGRPGNHRGGPPCHRIAQRQIEFPRLIAAKRQARQIIPFDQYPHLAAQCCRKPRTIVQGGRQVRQARARESVYSRPQFSACNSHLSPPEVNYGSLRPKTMPEICSV